MNEESEEYSESIKRKQGRTKLRWNDKISERRNGENRKTGRWRIGEGNTDPI